MKAPDPRELALARELAELVILDAVLRILAQVLAHEHPMIEEPAPSDPPSLLAARRLNATVRLLRTELRRYRSAVLDRAATIDEIPF